MGTAYANVSVDQDILNAIGTVVNTATQLNGRTQGTYLQVPKHTITMEVKLTICIGTSAQRFTLKKRSLDLMVFRGWHQGKKLTVDAIKIDGEWQLSHHAYEV